MANTYQEICQRVYEESGPQGSLSFPTTIGTLQSKCSASVKDAWNNIQTARDWTFFRKNISNFTLTSGKSIYTPGEVITTYGGYDEDLAFYPRQDAMYYEYKPLYYIHWTSIPQIDNTVGGEPRWYSMDPTTKNLHFNLPNDDHAVNLYYIRRPQILTEALNQTPDIPVEFEDLIYYFGLELFLTTIGHRAKYDQYEVMARDMFSRMCRKYVEKKRLPTRGGIV